MSLLGHREGVFSLVLLLSYCIFLYRYSGGWWIVASACLVSHLIALYATVTHPPDSPAFLLALLYSNIALFSVGMFIAPHAPLYGFLFLFMVMLPLSKLHRLKKYPDLTARTSFARFALAMLTPLQTLYDRNLSHPSHKLITPARLKAKLFRGLGKMVLQWAVYHAHALLPALQNDALRVALHYYALLWWTYLAVSAVMDLFSLYYEFCVGVPTHPMFNAPFLATSPRNFWGKRWNLPVTHFFKEFVFEVLQDTYGLSGSLAALVVFFGSGVAHEVFVCFVGNMEYLGWEMCFFLLHAGLCALEGWIPSGVKQAAPRALCIILCHVVMVVTCPLFFLPFENIYSPYFHF